ncbi:MAG: LytTR family DNA-binding domain-containing protein, partial [Pseudomonadota bacterium]
MQLKCAVLEDQRPAQEVLTTYIRESDGLQLLAVYGSAPEAAISLPTAAPDILFLDLHLPKMDGFAFLQTLAQPPLIIVTTADAEQAIEGYAHNVVDYLLKPFSFERFSQAVAKARQRLSAASNPQGAALTPAQNRDLFVKSKGEIIRVLIESIEFIKAESDYVEVFTKTEKFLFSRTLQSLQSELPADRFVRVHRS